MCMKNTLISPKWKLSREVLPRLNVIGPSKQTSLGRFRTSFHGFSWERIKDDTSEI